MLIRHAFHEELNQVLFEGNSCVKKVILNRPDKLNGLTYHMISQITKELKAYEIDSNVKVVILKGNGKSFSAGGDVIGMYFCMVTGHWSFGATFYKKQITLDYLVATYRKPVVALIDGIVMGGGAGLSALASFKIVTERTVFAMPEAAIGHFADVGASYFLSRLPGHFGEYLALTGAKLTGTEMVACGLATHFVLSKDLPSLESALQEVTSSDTNTISEIISKFVHKPSVQNTGAYSYSRLEVINKCCSRKTVEEIVSSLENEAKVRSEKWIVEAINFLKSACPISLKISLKSIREGRVQTLEQCLIREFNITCHVIRRTVNSDFYEGVRAKLLDKDKTPKWEPSKLELVSNEMVDQYLSRVYEDDCEVLLHLPVRSNLIDTLMRPKL